MSRRTEDIDDDPTFVPAEERVLGLDRRTFGLAGAVVVLFLVAVLVLPAVDGAVARNDVTTDGEVLWLAGRGALTVQAPGGWELNGIRPADGLAVDVPSSTRLDKEGVRVQIKVAAFDGDAAALMDRVGDLNDRQDDPLGIGGIRQRIDDATVGAGTPAVVEVYTGLDRKAVVVTWIETLPSGQKVGVEATVVGDADAVAAQLPSVLAMLDSSAVGPATSGAAS